MKGATVSELYDHQHTTELFRDFVIAQAKACDAASRKLLEAAIIGEPLLSQAWNEMKQAEEQLQHRVNDFSASLQLTCSIAEHIAKCRRVENILDVEKEQQA